MSEKFSEFFLDDPWQNMSDPNYLMEAGYIK